MGFLHGLLEFLNLLGAAHTRDIDFVNLNLFVLVDIDVHEHAVVARHVFALHDFHLCIVVALAVEVSLDDMLGAVNHVGRNLCAHAESQHLLEVFAFGLLDAMILDARDAGLGCQEDVQVDTVAHDAVGLNAHVRE